MPKYSSVKDALSRIKQLNELELVLLTQKQLPYVTAGYEELMRRYQSHLHSIAFRYLGNTSDAEDVVHDVMLKTFIHLKKFKNKSSFKTWLYRLAYNESVDKLRSNRKHASSDDFDVDSLPATDVKRTHTQEVETLHAWMGTLNAVDRSIIVFRVQFELDFKEIAEIMDLNLSTVKMKHKRALEKMRALNNLSD